MYLLLEDQFYRFKENLVYQSIFVFSFTRNSRKPVTLSLSLFV